MDNDFWIEKIKFHNNKVILKLKSYCFIPIDTTLLLTYNTTSFLFKVTEIETNESYLQDYYIKIESLTKDLYNSCMKGIIPVYSLMSAPLCIMDIPI